MCGTMDGCEKCLLSCLSSKSSEVWCLIFFVIVFVFLMLKQCGSKKECNIEVESLNKSAFVNMYIEQLCFSLVCHMWYYFSVSWFRLVADMHWSITGNTANIGYALTRYKTDACISYAIQDLVKYIASMHPLTIWHTLGFNPSVHYFSSVAKLQWSLSCSLCTLVMFVYWKNCNSYSRGNARDECNKNQC